MAAEVTCKVVGTIQDSEVVEYELRSTNTRVRCINYGATILSICRLETDGTWREMTLNYGTFDELYARRDAVPYYGCLVGRVANRICKGKFSLDGVDYALAVNNGENHLHGGLQGFDKKVWESHVLPTDTDSVPSAVSAAVQFHYLSVDGEEGYPGNLQVTLNYILRQDCLVMEYAATTDKATPINLTNHAYFNVSGNFVKSAADHRLMLSCSQYLPVDATQIPTQEICAVSGTAFDYLPVRVDANSDGANQRGGRLLSEVLGLVDGGGQPGVDHCFVVDADSGRESDMWRRFSSKRAIPAVDDCHREGDGSNVTLLHAATLSCARGTSGTRFMSVYTTQPAVQVYTANWLPAVGSVGVDDPHHQHNAVCIETQHYPDSINFRDGSIPPAGFVLRPNQEYYQQTALVFREDSEDHC